MARQNPLWDQLDEDRLSAMLVDGHHLPDAFVLNHRIGRYELRVLIYIDPGLLEHFELGSRELPRRFGVHIGRS